MNPPRWELAQFNIARLAAPLDSPQLTDFVANLATLNALAERSPGFVWRLQDEAAGDATSLRPLGPDVLVNLSVWRDHASLRDYVYRTEHVEFLKRRREWFATPPSPALVLWWTPAGERPAVEEGLRRLARLAEAGPCVEAFSFARTFPMP